VSSFLRTEGERDIKALASALLDYVHMQPAQRPLLSRRKAIGYAGGRIEDDRRLGLLAIGSMGIVVSRRNNAALTRISALEFTIRVKFSHQGNDIFSGGRGATCQKGFAPRMENSISSNSRASFYLIRHPPAVLQETYMQ
jgi:hypothetical protein